MISFSKARRYHLWENWRCLLVCCWFNLADVGVYNSLKKKTKFVTKGYPLAFGWKCCLWSQWPFYTLLVLFAVCYSQSFLGQTGHCNGSEFLSFHSLNSRVFFFFFFPDCLLSLSLCSVSALANDGMFSLFSVSLRNREDGWIRGVGAAGSYHTTVCRIQWFPKG